MMLIHPKSQTTVLIRTGLLPVFHALRGLICCLTSAARSDLDFLGHLDQGTTTTTESAQAVRHSRAINAVPLTDLYTFHRLDYPGDATKQDAVHIQRAVIPQGWVVESSRGFAIEETGTAPASHACFNRRKAVKKASRPCATSWLLCDRDGTSRWSFSRWLSCHCDYYKKCKD